MSANKAMSKRGFTLLELLVAISIIGVMLAILFPVFAQVREKARQSVCASNLRQIGMAIALYRTDYDDLFPYAMDNEFRLDPDPGAPWFAQTKEIPSIQDALQPYCKSYAMFLCPSDTGLLWPDGSIRYAPSRGAVLGMSYKYESYIGLLGMTEADFPDPARMSIADDNGYKWHSFPDAGYYDLKGNTLFMDGHVKIASHAKPFRLDEGK